MKRHLLLCAPLLVLSLRESPRAELWTGIASSPACETGGRFALRSGPAFSSCKAHDLCTSESFAQMGAVPENKKVRSLDKEGTCHSC